MTANDPSRTVANDEHRMALRVFRGALGAMGVCGTLWWLTGNHFATVLFLLTQAVLISIIIWQACDPFAEAAQWIGTVWRLPGSVRGATLDAIASSMPELLSGIFFVWILAPGNLDSVASSSHGPSQGLGATLATCAGSAVYNMILIPAICAIFISYYRPERPTIDVHEEVIARDGLWFLGCEIVLLVFLFQDVMFWWMGLVLLGFYGVYMYLLFKDARSYQRSYREIRQQLEIGASNDELLVWGCEQRRRISRDLIDRVQRDLVENIDEQDNPPPQEAEVLFGKFTVPLNHTTAWLVILGSTLVAAVACYWLVEVTCAAAATLQVPLFFVAVILAAAASSVPDTFLSIGSAKRGDDDGAVSNAFGSNIFDICICFAIPLLFGSFLNDWNPIELVHNGQPLPGLVGLRVLLVALTVITLLMMWHNRQLTRRKAWVLCGLYGLFVAYAVAGSLGWEL